VTPGPLPYALLAWLTQAAPAPGRASVPIDVTTANTALHLLAGDDGRLYQLHYGRARVHGDARRPAREEELHPQYGNGYVLEPALQVIHADGNTSTELAYIRHEAARLEGGAALTRIELADRHYPFRVTLHLKAYPAEDVIEQWMEVTHDEPGPVVLGRYASSALLLRGESYYLTQLQGEYMREAQLVEERLTPGLKVLDSKLGVRAHQMRNPSFLLALDQPAQEESGEVYGASLAWSGSFQLAFDLDAQNRLRALGGVQPLGAQYHLAPGRAFRTPAMLWTHSSLGKGGVSRNLHRWARRHGIREGGRPRPVLLNNWEATHMDFDEGRIVSLFDGARELGVELFLLDDGWFGNAYPRNDDRTGLGDWQVNARKLPRGLSHLAAEAARRGLGFGIWIEPEMVNPRSELFERHPDWVIAQPHRDLLFGRNQLVLDLTRPQVKQHVLRVIDDVLGGTPAISYVKWDANRYVTQPGSSHLPRQEQQNLLVDYQWALYDAMRHLAERYPRVMAMACAGGAGRVDYGTLRYFHSFWPSDNTDPLQRVFIQWGLGHVFPAAAMSAHVTDMGGKPLKFAVDVALSGAFGVDRDLARWTREERRQVGAAVALYRERLRELVLQGDLYRLQSPYERPQAALGYVSEDRSRAVVFVYRLGETAFPPVKPRGLDPRKRYRVQEVNLPEGRRSRLALHGQVVDGAVLMDEGFPAPLRRSLESAVIEITEEATSPGPPAPR
jgi:alpha-galactosidase